ncbi:MAG: ATP-binding protein [Syntrophobacteraceae bacterium]
MTVHTTNPNRWTWFSPWMIIGSVCLLAGILLFLTIKNVHREKEFTERALLSQANVLMRSVEAGSRTGMGMGWGYRQHQMLMEETAQQSDVLFLALLTPAGKVVAHSEPQEIGKTLSLSFPKPGETSYGFSEKSERRFEVMRSFQPLYRQRGRGRGSMDACDGGPPWQQKDLFILVALDPTPFDEASRQDIHQNMVLFGLMLLVGAAGFISLVWAQHFRQARTSLRDIRAFTSTVLNQMPDGLVITSLDGRIQRTNEAACLILQCTGEMHGRSIGDFPCFLPVADRLKKEEAVVEQEIQCRLSGSAAVPLLVRAALIRDSERRATGYLFLFSDITGIKQLEEQLRRSERLAGLGRLAAGVAHEIRNPLSSIKGFATILAGRFKEDERSRDIADVMVQEVERLNRVVTELLNFAKPTELNRQRISCQELVQDSLKLIEKDALRQGVKVESAIDPQDLQLDVDPDRFSQILLNLYLNAIHAMKQGGTLGVRTFQENGDTIIVVSDSGTGISAEHLPHVFDPYFTTKPQGVGLGLANVHKFVEAHGGEIEVQSIPAKGTQFTIRLCSKEPEGSSCNVPLKAMETTKNGKSPNPGDFNSR